MRVTPKTEKQIAEEGMFPAGIYSAEVVKAEDTVSKAGNDMIALTLRVYHGDRTALVNDYLLDSMAYKVRHAAGSMGLLDSYEMGALVADDMVGKSVTVKLNVQKDKSGQYPDKNGIADYLDGNAQKTPVGAGAALDDEIPFGPCID
jgi:hypothetical protein